jgi:transcriptional regulator with XRE-family HTH domain
MTLAPRRKEIPYALTRDGAAFAQLLRDMQRHAGLSTRSMARRIGVEPSSINQYLWKKRGRGGSSTLRWFLRFAEACGCRLYMTFPTPDAVRYLERMPPKAPILFGVGGPESPCDP